MIRRTICLLVWLVTAAILLQASQTPARDLFMVISGGGSPMGNNFSQYLQAKGVAEGFSEGRRGGAVWVFFGAGNEEGKAPVFGDVRRRVPDGKRSLDSWLPGSLPNNRPARRAAILQALEKEILPQISGGGRLFLFVGDHGSRAPSPPSESIITLWGLAPDAANPQGWSFDENQMLRVSELRELFQRGLGKGKVIFCMTQCHSGGFHFISIPHEVRPNPAWFNQPPAWIRSLPIVEPLAVAGFTATDELSLASGCDAEPTDEEWEGYERFFPRQLFGIDPLTRERMGSRLRSFSAAHVAAVLEDRTIDNPYSTSEQYLERWATLLETRLAGSKELKPRIAEAVNRFQRAVESGQVTASDRSFRNRQDQFRTFVQSLVRQIPDQSALLWRGSRESLAKLAAEAQGAEEEAGADQPDTSEAAQPRKGRATPEMKKLWAEVVRPAWASAVKSGSVNNLVGLAAPFELRLLRDEEKGREIFFAPRGSLEMDVFWYSGYADPKTLQRDRAEAVVRWGMDRRRRILSWAKSSGDPKIRAAAIKLSSPRPRKKPSQPDAEPMRPLSEEPVALETAAARTLFYRRTLAAWAFLLEVDEKPALGRLKELIELENTPFPWPSRK